MLVILPFSVCCARCADARGESRAYYCLERLGLGVSTFFAKDVIIFYVSVDLIYVTISFVRGLGHGRSWGSEAHRHHNRCSRKEHSLFIRFIALHLLSIAAFSAPVRLMR